MSKSYYAPAIKLYREAFRQHGRSPASVLWPKGRQELRFSALTRHFDRAPLSLLDYGCGLADLKSFINDRFPQMTYYGADMVPEFVADNGQRYPEADFQLVNGPADITRTFDYIAMSGVFNLRYECSEAEHKVIVRNALTHLFKHARLALSVDFMTDQVDYQQQGAYHQNVFEIYEFVRSELSKRAVIDQSYLPYEFCVTVFADAYRSEGPV